MRTDLKVPFAEKDEAHKLGARWDSKKKTWYVENHPPLPDFARWLPLPPSPTSSDALRSEVRMKVGGSGHKIVGSPHATRQIACDCSLMWECEPCRSRQSLR